MQSARWLSNSLLVDSNNTGNALIIIVTFTIQATKCITGTLLMALVQAPVLLGKKEFMVLE